MNKTLFIMSEKSNILSAIEKEVGKNGVNLFIVGKGPINEATIKNISFSQPNFVLTDELELKMARQILELCKGSRIIMLAEDINRASSVQTELEKEGKYNVDYINLHEVNPTGLIQLLNELEIEEVVDDEPAYKPAEPIEQETVLTTEDFLKMNDAPVSAEEVVEKQEENAENTENANSTYDHSKFENDYSLTKDNLMNLKNKTITIFSKKGGTGKSTIAKEMANVYSNVTLPKRFSKTKENLKVCLLDLDLERGNLRTLLGIHNPTPNIYMWITDILTKNIEQNLPMNKIKFNKISVMENYVIKPTATRHFYSVITDQGELSGNILNRLALSKEEDAFEKVIDIIIESLKRIFDIVIIDAGTDFNELSLSAMSHSDDILYVVEPNLTDVENLKVTLDELKKIENVDPTSISIVFNKVNKKMPLTEKVQSVLNQTCRTESYNIVTGKVESKELNCLTSIEYETDLNTFNNQFMFITNSNCPFKVALLRACKELLPIFKSKTGAKIATSNDSAKKTLMLKKKKELEEKKKKELELKRKKKKE